MFYWEKYSFTAQRKIETERALTGKVKATRRFGHYQFVFALSNRLDAAAQSAPTAVR